MMTEAEARKRCAELGMDYEAIVQWAKHPMHAPREERSDAVARQYAHDFIASIVCPVLPIIPPPF